jgi:hypothetical protein
MKTVAAAFSSVREAELAAMDLERIGVPRESISVIAGNDAQRHDEYIAKAKESSVSTEAAAASSASFGGGMGIVATLAALAIPGVGPILALGPLMTIVAGLGVGAAAGGLIGALKHMGVSHEDAPFYEEAVRRGAVMVTADVSEPLEEQASGIMRSHGARDLKDEANAWREGGWQDPSANAHPYPLDDSIRS